jgi:ABC-type transport system involved in multi-copper enzyme maturation permease subunit
VSAFLNVVQAELFKAVRKRRTYVLAALWWVLLPALILIVARVIQVNVSGSFVEENVSVQSILQLIGSPFGVARLGLVLPALSGPTFYVIVVALLAALFIGEERSQNMWKTTLVAQPSRLAVLSGKFAVAMLLFGVYLLGAFVSGALFGALGMLFLPTTFAGDWAALLGLYGLQWLYAAAATAFAFLMIWLLRNQALGLVSIFFLPALLEGLYTLYATTVGFQPLNRLNAIFQALRLQQTLEDLPRYFFTSNLYAPARAPLREIATAFGEVPTGPNSDLGPFANLFGAGITLEHAALVMAVYTLLFGAILTWSFLRRDVA